NGIHVDPSKIEAVKNWKAPRTPSEDKILGARKEAVNESVGLQKGLDEMMQHKSNGTLYYLDQIWAPLRGDVKAEHQRPSGLLQQPEIPSERTIQTLEDMLGACVLDFEGSWDVHLSLVEFSYNNSYHSSVRCSPFEALYSRNYRTLIMWAEVRERQLIGHELVQETTEKILQIKDRLKATHDRQKSYDDKTRKPLEFSVDKIRVDATLNFMEEPVEILDREFKKLRRSRIAIVKVRWNSKRDPECTWEREDQMKLKYPYLFSDISG
nr:putative reverse transcriptase domain-containing protein [Tanacetum cinerariifolium]